MKSEIKLPIWKKTKLVDAKVRKNQRKEVDAVIQTAKQYLQLTLSKNKKKNETPSIIKKKIPKRMFKEIQDIPDTQEQFDEDDYTSEDFTQKSDSEEEFTQDANVLELQCPHCKEDFIFIK